MRMKIDFAGGSTPPSPAGLLAIALAVVACVGAVAPCLEAFGQLQQDHATLAGARLRVQDASVSLSPKQIESVNRTVRQLNLPWASLWDAVEAGLSDRVALLSLEPEAGTRTLRLQGEAKSAEDMIDFTEALANDKRFLSARLVRHDINDSDRNRPYRFQLEAQWSDNL
jgi:Tfp pilus assembly protein PilN